MRLGHRAGFFGGEKIVYFFNKGKVDGYNWTITRSEQGSIGSTLSITTSHQNWDDGSGHGENDGKTEGSQIKITVDVSKYNSLYVNITRQEDGGVVINQGSTERVRWTTVGLHSLNISSYSNITIQLYTSDASAAYEPGVRTEDKNYITVNQVYASKELL